MCSSDLEAGAKQIAFVVEEHLGFVDQAPKRGGMHDAIAVALKPMACGCVGFRVTTPARAVWMAGIGRKHRCRNRSVWRVGNAHAGRQQASITSATSASGAPRTTALPGPSINTKRMSPAWAFLSTRMWCR